MSNQATPLATDGYSRLMVAGFDEKTIIGTPTGFQAMFGRTATGSKTVFATDAKIVEIDIKRGNERLAATIRRGGIARAISGQANTSLEQYTTFSRQYPLIEEEGDINADQILMRVAGEAPYEGRRKMRRMRDLGSEHHQEHIRRCIRLFEVLAAQSVVLGIQDSMLGTSNTDLQYDFHRLATHTVTASPLWNGTTPTIMADIDAQCNLIRRDGHVNPDIMIMGSTVAAAFVDDAAIIANADVRRINQIEVNQLSPVPPHLKYMVDGGFIPLGQVRTSAGYRLWMFTYLDVYTASGGTATPYMDVNKVVFMSSEARFDRYFGPNEVLPMTPQRLAFMQENFGISITGQMPPKIKSAFNVIRPEMFFFDAYGAANNKSITVRTQAAPIFPTTMTDSIVTLIAAS